MGSKDRLTRDALTHAVAHFSALAEAYASAEDSDLTTDREAADVVRTVVVALESFEKQRRAQDVERARVAIAVGLRSIYMRVSGGDAAETEAPPSRRTWHEGIWQTDDERRAAIARTIVRWIPTLEPAEAAAADLSAEQIGAHGGPRAAADHVVAALFERERAGVGFRGATVFGLPLQG